MHVMSAILDYFQYKRHVMSQAGSRDAMVSMSKNGIFTLHN